MKTRLLILFMSILSLNSCCFKTPDFVSLNAIEINEVSLNTVSADINVTLHNSNRRNIVIKKSDVDVIIKDRNIGKLLIKNELILPAKSDTACDFAIKMSTREALKTGISSVDDIMKTKIEVRLTGNIEGEYWFLKKKIKIDKSIKP